jgi:ribulose-phosphate 3-epimerase
MKIANNDWRYLSMYHIAPSVFCANSLNIMPEIEKLEQLGVDWYHFDIMDGTFVRNFALGTEFAKDLKKKVTYPLYVHMMTVNPGNHIELLRDAGADYMCFHLETVTNPFKIANDIRKNGMKPCVAINPITPVEALAPLLSEIDVVTIMSMEPGFLGQPFMTSAYERILRLREMIASRGLKTMIEIDGAVNPEIGAKCLAAGADVVVAGFAFLFDRSSTLEEEYRLFNSLIKQDEAASRFTCHE